MATFGEALSQARKKKSMKSATLAQLIGKSEPALSGYENDARIPDPDTVNLIAEALQDNSIRLAYLETNPVFQAVIPRIFPELNNIRREPAIVFSRFADEAEESARSARLLSQLFAHAEPRTVAGFAEMFATHMEQIVDIQRCAEILMTALIAAQVMSESERVDLYSRQQHKCEQKGHHVLPRTGTEG